MRKRSSLLPIYLCYLALSLLFLFLTFATRLPFLYGIAEISMHPFSLASYTALMAGRAGLDSVHEENSMLHQKLVQSDALQKEDAALHDQYQTTSLSPSHLIPVHILSQRSFVPGVSAPESFVIDRGSSDHVSPGMAVIYKDNLLGIVSTVSPFASVVTLVTNPQTTITAMTSQTNAAGIVKGGGKGKYTYVNVLLADKLQSGDVVVTKGTTNDMGIGISPNLVIGKVTTIYKRASDLFQGAELQSLIDVTKLTTVFIERP